MFEATTFNWKGRDFTIPPDRIMGAIASVEDVVTLGELATMQSGTSINLSKIAKAYATVLRYAGADATWEDVYGSLFGDGNGKVMVALRTLMLMMVPPSVMISASPGKPPTGKNRAGRRSSKSPTKRRSA